MYGRTRDVIVSVLFAGCFSILLVIVGCVGIDSGSVFNPTMGLIHYYPFLGDADDYGQETKNGTVEGATLTTDRNGVEDSAYSFDGVARITLDYFPVPDTFTLSAWIKTAETSGNILLWREIPPGPGTDGEGLLVYENHITFTESNGLMVNDIIGNTNIASDSWVHVVAVKSGDALILYVNGTYETADTLSMTLILNELTIGDSFIGKIDDVRVYDRALSGTDITALYSL